MVKISQMLLGISIGAAALAGTGAAMINLQLGLWSLAAAAVTNAVAAYLASIGD